MTPQLDLVAAARRLNWQPETLLESAARGRIEPLVFLPYQNADAGEIRSATLEEIADLERYESVKLGAVSAGDAAWFVPLPPPEPGDRFTLGRVVWRELLEGATRLNIPAARVAKHHHLPEPKQGFEWIATFSPPVLFRREQIFFQISDLNRLKQVKLDLLDELILRLLDAEPDASPPELWYTLLHELGRKKRRFDRQEILFESSPPNGRLQGRTLHWKPDPTRSKTRRCAFANFRNRISKLRKKS